MLEKFIELVELQVKVYNLECEIENEEPYHICSLNKIQLMKASQSLFDGFCKHMKLIPKIDVYPWENSIHRTQEVYYKNIRILVHEADYKEDETNG